MVTHISRVLNLHQIWEAATYQAVLKSTRPMAGHLSLAQGYLLGRKMSTKETGNYSSCGFCHVPMSKSPNTSQFTHL